MRFAVAALLVSAVAASAVPDAAAESDEIKWIRSNGSAGWSASIPRETRPAGVVAKPLVAPTWFPKLPNATVELVPSGSLDLAATRGKVVVIDYWASWCGPCLRELPHLQQLHTTRGPKGLVALAINVDEDAATTASAARRLGLTMSIGMNDAAFYRLMGPKSLPTLFVIDRQGRIRARWNGYRTGYEMEIAEKVDALLADDASDTTHKIADVLVGAKLFAARWSRDLPGNADGVVGLPAGAPDGVRALASAGGMLIPFLASGETIAPTQAVSCAGRLLDFGVAADGSREIAGFRPGGSVVGVAALASGKERAIAVPAPIVDVAVAASGSGENRHLAVATMGGAMLAGATDHQATPLDGAGAVRAVVSRPGRGVLALRADGSISTLDAAAEPWPAKAVGAARLLAAREDGAAAGPRTALASAYGRFLPGNGSQLAVATYAGHLVLLDAADGRVLFDAVWADVRDLSATDLDGDGLDELLVAAGRSVSAIGAAQARRGTVAAR